MKNVLLYRVDDPSRPGNRLEGSAFVIRTVDPEVSRRVQGAVQAHFAHEVWGIRMPYAVGLGVILVLAHVLRNLLLRFFPDLPSFWVFAGIALVLGIAFTLIYLPLAKKILRKGKKNRLLAEQCNDLFRERKASLRIPEEAQPFRVYLVPAHGRGKERVAGDVKYDFHGVDGFLFEEEGRLCVGLTREVLAFDPQALLSLTLRREVRHVYDRPDGVDHGNLLPELLSSEQHVSRRVEEYGVLTLRAEEDWELFLPLSSAEILAERAGLQFEK